MKVTQDPFISSEGHHCRRIVINVLKRRCFLLAQNDETLKEIDGHFLSEILLPQRLWTHRNSMKLN